MPKFAFLRIALLALLVLIFQGTWALAGTTGALTGSVVLNDGTPLAGAKVTVTSPSESKTATTDSTGHFAIVSLIPDTYTVVVTKDGYDTQSQSGITVFADNTHTVTVKTQASVKVIGTVPVRASAELVKPGTTADVYSVNAKTAENYASLGGGGGADNAYGAIATIPGVYVPVGQVGWYQNVYIRGGDYDQVGYEYDGVPVNRSFDNYPSSTASSLGQQQLQLYTGGAPANAESQGIAGFINQVIRTGSYPGFGTLDLGVGGPSLYNKLNLEFGGATPNRNFSYYMGVGGYNLRPRYYDQSNGASLQSTYGLPFSGGSSNASGIGPNGYNLAPWDMFDTFEVADRETVANFHFAIPHHNDSGKDDIQFLYSTSLLRNPFYSSALDYGSSFLTATTGFPTFFYVGGSQYNGHLGDTFNGGVVPNIINYSAPSSGQPIFGNVPADLRDSSENGQGIGKLQYQHNIGTSAYIRLYGYSYYSWWFLHGADSTGALLDGGFTVYEPDDYELITHTRGVSLQFQDQLDAKNLLGFETSYTTASTVRDNNTQGYGQISGSRSRFAVLVNSLSPTSGLCYNTANTAVPVSCEKLTHPATWVFYQDAAVGAEADVTGMTCGSGAGAGPCEYLVVENGPYGTYNTVKPRFTAAALTDQYKATDKLLLNLGLRLDRYEFIGANTTGGARTFFFNAWNKAQCVATIPGSLPFDKATVGLGPLDPCPVGTVPATMTNSPVDYTYTETEPRFGGTYTISSDDVLRFSYGKLAEPPSAAFQQYNTLQQDLPEQVGTTYPFFAYGFHQPGHNLGPATSDNADFSWEHRFRGSDVSFKLSPFYRKTKGQFENFFLDQVSGFVSAFPVGKQTSEGVEFELSKGDFSANGLSGIVSFTYTYSYITLGLLPNGGTVFSPVNIAITNYNDFTKFCSVNFSDARCGGLAAAPTTASPCFTTAGAPVACAAGDVANPYWNAPAQALFDPNGKYIPYSTIPNGFNSAASSFEVPYSATVVLNFKHDKWAVTPLFQYSAGGYYGAPLQSPGINPATCSGVLATAISGDPRYPFGAAGGNPYDAATCGALTTTTGALTGIPDPYTGNFDQPGAFRQPSHLTAHLQLKYEATSRMTLTGAVLNIINRCNGGTGGPWTQAGNYRACSYSLPGYIPLPYAGNIYNPGDTFQPVVQFPYMPYFGVQPISYSVEAKFSL